MATFAVWYMRPEFFRDGIMGAEWLAEKNMTPNTDRLDLSHVFVRYVQADSVEQVFGMMQGEVWSPNGEARDRIKMLGLQHTSMSVGDIAVDVSNKAVHLCDRYGFKVLAEQV
jgi:hypothetical protein